MSRHKSVRGPALSFSRQKYGRSVSGHRAGLVTESKPPEKRGGVGKGGRYLALCARHGWETMRPSRLLRSGLMTSTPNGENAGGAWADSTIKPLARMGGVFGHRV